MHGNYLAGLAAYPGGPDRSVARKVAEKQRSEIVELGWRARITELGY